MCIFISRAFHYVLMSAYYSLGTAHIRKQYLPQLPTLQQLFQEISGMLILHNDVWEYPRPYPRTFINVLGMNLEEDPGEIPEVKRTQFGNAIWLFRRYFNIHGFRTYSTLLRAVRVGMA